MVCLRPLLLSKPELPSGTSLQSIYGLAIGRHIRWSNFQFEKYCSLGIDITPRCFHCSPLLLLQRIDA